MKKNSVIRCFVNNQLDPSLWHGEVIVKNIFIVTLPDNFQINEYTLTDAIVDKSKGNVLSSVLIKGY